ncbi:MAG: acetate uptake transporter [Cryobacterium sp.]
MNQINTTIPQAPAASAPAASAPVAAAPSHGALADPGSLGLAAFALTTFVLSMSNTGIVPSSAAVLGLALFYGGIAQVLAGLWEFYNRNTFGATAFTSFGAFWLSFWYLESTGGNVEAGAAGMGTFLLAWTIFTLYMTVAAKKTNGSIFAVFVALTITFLFLAIGAYTGITAIHQLGGWFGILTALLAWYGSFAVVFNSTAGRAVLPVWPSK